MSRDPSTNGHASSGRGSSAVGGGGDDPVAALRAGSRETLEELREAKERISAAVDERRGGPAEDVDDARAKLDDLRSAIDRDLAALRDRVPDPEAIDSAKRIGVGVGGGLAALLVLRALAKGRKERARRHEDLREQAVALARELAKLDEVDLVLAEEAEGGGRTGRRLLLLLIAAIGVAATVWTRSQPAPEELDVWGPPT